MPSSKYSKEQLEEMATVVMNNRGTQRYIDLTEAVSFFTQLPLQEVVSRIEDLANARQE